MVLRSIWIVAVSAFALAWCGLSVAQEYRPDEFLNLDLSRAVLSPKPLGPAAGFKQGPVGAGVDSKNNAARASVEPTTSLKMPAHAERRAPSKPRALVTFHRRNPVEAQARDFKIQTWPCKSGGICGWKR